MAYGGYGRTTTICYVNAMRDMNGNVVVYVGKKLGDAGEKLVMKATIKSHEEYKGVKQTKVSRPFIES
jgi:hypothetical protein